MQDRLLRRGPSQSYALILYGIGILVATGSFPLRPPVEGIDSERCVDSTALLAQEEVPRRLVVLGGGIIGCEFASIFERFGTEVTMIEMLDTLIPQEDSDATSELRKTFARRGIVVHLPPDAAIDPGVVATALGALADGQAARVVPIAQLFSDVPFPDEGPATLEPAPTSTADLRPIAPALESARDRVAGVGDLLDDPDTGASLEQSLLLSTGAATAADQRRPYIDRTAAALDDLDGIVALPEEFRITLPSRSSTIPVALTNLSEQELTVRVELDARQEPLGKLTAQIAEAGGALQGVDLVPGAGSEGKRVRPSKPLLDEAIKLADHPHGKRVILQRPQVQAEMGADDVDWAEVSTAGMFKWLSRLARLTDELAACQIVVDDLETLLDLLLGVTSTPVVVVDRTRRVTALSRAAD